MFTLITHFSEKVQKKRMIITSSEFKLLIINPYFFTIIVVY